MLQRLQHVKVAGACRVLKGDYIRRDRAPWRLRAGACRVLKGDYIADYCGVEAGTLELVEF